VRELPQPCLCWACSSTGHPLKLDRTAAPCSHPWPQHAAWRTRKRSCTPRRPGKLRSTRALLSADGRRHRYRNRGASFGSGDVVRASSDRVDHKCVIRRLGAGARRHAQQLGHASPKRPIARRAAATARPSSKVESSEFSDVGSGSRGTRRTPGTAARAPWGRVKNCVVISATQFCGHQ